MLSHYKEITNNRIIDNVARSEFAVELRALERVYNVSPIADMTESECSNLEYQLAGNYAKSLAKIYECYDKLLGIEITDIDADDVAAALAKMEDHHTRSIFTILTGTNSIYGITSAVIMNNSNAKHFLSRYNVISDMRPTTCCNLI